ncbi:hypothetical protein SERLA73DRAFT_50792 [Serpula lacrymans var. lacrymans S7.3]|uniref:FAD dependent oxidoreductase domain-containing protein n=1 Tax=Serpula lacrymans var. lacrymans (strain S7.3) TaxID=936435 RepID=F8PS32_SERL3|nr:hypothetical protein SERLA73DRAFT_50792 [Serpula lacrymans var. lacrymans S7.3]
MTDRKVLIVGAGCFGISTAYHLLKRGYGDVTIIDRSVVLPAPDAASTDMNKVVRSSYSDIFYSKLAQEAIRAWKNEEDWGTTYHESGVVVLDPPAAVGEGPIESYADMSFDNDVEIGARVRRLEDSTAVRSVFPSSVASSGRLAPLSDATGYLASDGGWAEAAQGVSLMTSRVVALGGRVVPGKTAEGLVREDGATKGVRCTDGSLFYADLVVLAAGSWMASSFPELNLDTKCLATGQSVAMVQLTREEADVYRDCPVVLNFRTGFYIFPPDKHDVVKLSIHAAGHTHMAPHPTAQRLISTPRTILSHADEGLRIPRTVAIELRGHLSHIYPELANKPFIQTRMCW